MTDITNCIYYPNVYIPKLLKGMKLVSSANEARRLISQNGIKIDGKTIGLNEDIKHGMIITIGKRRIYELQLPKRTATEIEETEESRRWVIS